MCQRDQMRYLQRRKTHVTSFLRSYVRPKDMVEKWCDECQVVQKFNPRMNM